MGPLNINLENCYGIGELKVRIPSDIEKNTYPKIAIIYAPNGMMKTSLTRTIRDLINGEEPKDEFFPERKTSAYITIGGNKISNENTYIFENSKEDSKASISTFLANKELKTKYDSILSNLDDCLKQFNKKIAEDSKSSDWQEELLKAFPTKQVQSIYECLLHIKQKHFQDSNQNYAYYDFRFNDIFDKSEKVKKFIEDNKSIIQDYFNNYQEILKQSEFFSDGNDSFGTYQASTLLKAVSDNRYFKAGHKLLLKNSSEQIVSQEQLEKLYNEEIKKVCSDEKLKKTFDKIDKKLQGNNELRTFKEIIQNNPHIIASLLDYDEFKKKVFLGYIYKNITEFNNLVNLYQKEKQQINDIINEANNSIDKWNTVIELFNSRFFVPFKVSLKNQSDLILNEQTPALDFEYCETKGDSKKTSQKELMQALSLGEQRAFHILQNLFEIEARRTSKKETLVILDDIADSFDYKNKYAIIEYLADLQQTDSLFSLLILTHNFDFYRTAVSRLQIQCTYFANKTVDRTIKLCKGQYSLDILKNVFIKNGNEKKYFIGLIPFVRNLVEYTKGQYKEYSQLTNCLHLKEDTSNIKIKQIWEVLQNNLLDLKKKTISFGEEKYIDVLYEVAKKVLDDIDEVNLANKLVLSMAIRLKAEDLLLNQIFTEDQKIKAKSSNSNQTGVLVRILKKEFASKVKLCLLMDKVLMLTSENIHMNNFMFEPLVDMPINHLKQLYKDISSYKSNDEL